MKTLTSVIISIALLVVCSLSSAATLNSMNKTQVEQAFINKTSISIPTDNLNGRTIDNTFSMFLDNKGNIFGKMSHKPANQPQIDKGVYSINDSGILYITWEHWDEKKKLCAHVYNTKNAYIPIACDNVFHTVFMKADIRLGNQL